MSYKIIIEPKAELDIINAAFWYKGKQNGLAKKMEAELQKKISLIARSPLIYAVRYAGDIRIAKLSVFPYSIHYIIDEDKNIVFIVAVLHDKIDPESWLKIDTL